MENDSLREGLAKLESGELLEARRLLEEAERASPGSAQVVHAQARLADLVDDGPRAKALFERAHGLDPAAPEPACDLAMLHLAVGEDEEAAAALEPALAAHPEHPRVRLHMAMALAKSAPGTAREHAAVALEKGEGDLAEQARALYQALATHAPG